MIFRLFRAWTGAAETAPDRPQEGSEPAKQAAQGAAVAAIAAALRLHGRESAPPTEVAAAVATALALHLAAVPSPRTASPAESAGWKITGRWAAMDGRVRLQGRSLRR